MNSGFYETKIQIVGTRPVDNEEKFANNSTLYSRVFITSFILMEKFFPLKILSEKA